MTKIDTIRRVEEASFNAWPALNTVIYDGWLLRFANGYTKRANSVNGLYAGKLAQDTKVAYCQRIYRAQKLRPVFRLTPLIRRSELDDYLQKGNYQRCDHTSVQLLDLRGFSPKLSPRAEILSDPDRTARWLRVFHDLNPQRTDAATHQQMLQNILGALCLMVLHVGQEVAACGLAVADGEYVGLFDIVTAVEQRRKGYGLELTSSLLAWGAAAGARFAYLQVMTANRPALHLYGKLHFEELYDYWYRLAPDEDERRSYE